MNRELFKRDSVWTGPIAHAYLKAEGSFIDHSIPLSYYDTFIKSFEKIQGSCCFLLGNEKTRPI